MFDMLMVDVLFFQNNSVYRAEIKKPLNGNFAYIYDWFFVNKLLGLQNQVNTFYSKHKIQKTLT